MNAARSWLRSSLDTARTHGAGVAWMLAEKAVLLASALVFGFWVVRELGPENYGHFSVALSIVAVFGGLATMGLETVALRHLAAGAHDARSVLRCAAALRFGGSLLQVAACWLTARLLFAQEPDVAGVALILASAAIFRIWEPVGLWLQAQNRYRDAAGARIAIRCAGDAFRLLLILQHASIYWFAAAFLFESIAAALLFAWLGRPVLRGGGALDRALVRSLFAEGRPVMIGALISGLYARIDQMALYAMQGAGVAGTYAAAVRISEAVNLLIVSVGAVAAAQFARLGHLPDVQFDARLQTYHRGMLATGVLLALLLCLGAGPIVHLLYGTRFDAAAPVLRVHAWTLPLVFASVAIEPWFYHHGQLGSYVHKTLVALAFAVPAVLAGTWWFGAVGTAAAVVATYFVSVVVSSAIVPGARRAWRFQCQTFSILGSAQR
jgi:polysaccharide transporter, PST family